MNPHPAPDAASNAHPQDAALMARVAAGDAEAGRRLVERYAPRMLAVARRLAAGEADAADAVQDALLSALCRAGEFRGDARLSTWLHRVTVNACLMQRRARRRSRRREERATRWAAPTAAVDAAADPHAHACRRESADSVHEAIGRLAPRHRDVLLLRDVQGLDTGRAAAALGTTPAGLKVRLHRARRALRPLLSSLTPAG